MDDAALSAIVTTVVDANPDLVAKYKAGKIAVIGALVGEIMKATKGQANPKTINDILKNKLT
jgi:aspartyl-tRNA(Asn)/glutamyl-tRNA(Gln) amidotransferase subunit B